MYILQDAFICIPCLIFVIPCQERNHNPCFASGNPETQRLKLSACLEGSQMCACVHVCVCSQWW